MEQIQANVGCSIENFPIHGFISGSAFRVVEETLLIQSFPPKKLEHKLKHADKPSMFLEVSERCFQHALDSINVCGKAGPCLWHVWFFYTKCGLKMPPSLNIVGIACWD